jgi:iron complex outermembrane receptor protein
MLKVVSAAAFAALVSVFPTTAVAQTTEETGQGNPPAGQQAQAPVRAPGATVLVTAQKEPADPSKLPVSVTAVSDDLIKSAGITFVSDAGMFSPNTHFTEFSARKLSNPRIRGIGASPANPGVTTYVDGVPQLNSNTSSFDLVDVSQIEFVRGPQSALFGRNALGGLINISSGRPSLSKWGGNFSVPFGSDDMFDVRAGVSGPIATDKLAVGFSMAYATRDGFSTNVVTGNDIDSRESFAGKGQLLWTPNSMWETRVIISGERARDGDYALNDLAAVRANPFEVARDYEGFTNRDIFSATALVAHKGEKISFLSTTGIVDWNTLDSTDLDYTPFPLSTRENKEEAVQFTQEVRFSSTAAAPIKVSDTSALRWQAGAVFFTQNYHQNAVNTIAPFVLNPQIPFTVRQTSPNAALDDVGVGMYGQGTLAFSDKFDLSFGLRFDYENRKADLLTSFDPPIGAPPVVVNEERDFSDVSPQIAAAWRLKGQTLAYGTFSRAYKTGGFNPVSLPGSESYGEEHAWNIEGGIKSTVANGRVGLTASVFAIDWDDLQLNLPIGPAQFYIANVGGATSRGAEFEVTTRAYEGLDVFGALGFTRARFADGTSSQGVDVSDKTVPNTPAYTATFGAQYTRALNVGGRLYGRGEVAIVGKFHYDEANTQHQDDYAVTNFRAGWKGKMLTVEGWVRNAFDTSYVPLAFAFPGGLQPSGFLAEPGRPRTAGISIGIGF